MGFVLGESRGRKPCVFLCKVAPAGDERYLVCAAGAGWVRPRLGVVRTVMAASMCFVYNCTLSYIVFWNLCLQTHCNGCMIVVVLCCHVRREMRVFEPDVARRIVMAAWMLHGLRFGRKPGQETLCFFG